ncbi:PREDICTED: nucleolar protein 9 [Nipponia nippon]|uniref:nucleolar protein 9 n=1 Tax=Nipponia nippon TaxID=128390 RepID=UPI000511928B|nr:PREDICTED: nucleolar protein 9 [Nipponia nippon]
MAPISTSTSTSSSPCSRQGQRSRGWALFAPNVLAEAAAAGLGVALDPGGSRVLQALLPQAPLGMLGRVLPPLVVGGVPQLPPGGAQLKAKGVELTVKAAEAVAEGAELPPSFPLLLGQLAEVFEEHLASLLSPASASLCLQVALEVLHHSQSPACSRLCDALIGQLAPPIPTPTESTLVWGLQDPERSRLLEAAMAVVGPQCLRELFHQQLKGHLRGVAAHRVANHGLQRLLDHAPADVVGEVLSELGPALAEPLACGHPGVLTALLGACCRHPSLQQEALRCLFQAFGCWDPRERRQACVGLLARLCPFGGGDKDMEGAEPEPSLGPITLHGSLLLQHLLHFRDPGPVLAGLEALPHPALAALARSPPGSRVWDALLASPTVPTRARRRLLRKLKGHFLSLACHRNGSRVLDAIWASASAPARAAIANELVSQHQALQRDPHGRGVARTLALDLFCRRHRLWEQLQAAPDRRRGLLEPLLED